MSKLPEAFQGHDLTGWNLCGQSISRLTNRGNVIEIKQRGCEFSIYGVGFVYSDCLGEMLRCADRFALKFGGWAPAPIGYSADPGWQPIATAPNDGLAFIGADARTGFVSECYWSLFSHEIHSYGSPVELTHWMPRPAPPEAKQ